MRQQTAHSIAILFTAIAAVLSATGATAEQSFGSQDLLNSCWTSEQLKGNARDKTVYLRNVPAYTPPAGTLPLRSAEPLAPNLRNSIRHVKPFHGQKVVALTFDLCERARETTGYDAELVNCLREHKVKATFFAGGKWMRSHPEKTMQLMADPLFEIGNHAWTHGNLRVLKGDGMLRQILWTQRQYEILRDELVRKPCAQKIAVRELDKIPKSMRLFRFPYGACSPESLQALASLGLAAIQWDIVTGDPSLNQTAEGIYQYVMSTIKPGSIIVGHANGRGHGTARAVAMIIQELHRKGYAFVTVSELLGLGDAVATQECYENKPGDNAFYDTTVGAGTN